MTKKLFGLLVSVAAAAIAAPARAAVLIDTVGQTFEVNYEGKVNGSPTDKISAEQVFTLTGISADTKTYTFSYSLSNTSQADSRLRSFGFNVLGADVSTLSAMTGLYQFGSLLPKDNNYPEGVGVLDACFSPSNMGNCTGGPKGIKSGLTENGTFALTLSTPATSFSLDNFTTRFQSITPSINGGDSGVGIGVVTAVPELGTWGMMILGLAGIGVGLRRRRDTAAPADSRAFV